MNKDDHLSGETSISARLEENGLTASANSRAIAAFDRLIGSALDIPTAYLEGVVGRARIKNEIREAVIKAAGKQVVHDDVQIQYAATKLLENFGSGQVRAIENKIAVAQEAIQLLTEEVIDGEDEMETQIDDDWLNKFERHAEDATSEGLRMLWAKVLTNEIRKPGKFSLSTMRVVAELDKTSAELFQTYGNDVFSEKYLALPSTIESTTLNELSMLEDAGLLSSLSSPSSNFARSIAFDKEFGTIWDGKLILRLQKKGITELSIKCTQLTKAGVEIQRILSPRNIMQALEKVFEHIENKVDGAEILQVLEQTTQGTAQARPIKILKAIAK